jgi:hypothetical protein
MPHALTLGFIAYWIFGAVFMVYIREAIVRATDGLEPATKLALITFTYVGWLPLLMLALVVDLEDDDADT